MNFRQVVTNLGLIFLAAAGSAMALSLGSMEPKITQLVASNPEVHPVSIAGRALVIDTVQSYETSHFIFYYSVVGPHTLPFVDGNNDGVNDHLAQIGGAAERIWRAGIDTLGYLPPLITGDSTFTYRKPIPAGKVPVELVDMGTASSTFKSAPYMGFTIDSSLTKLKVTQILLENDFIWDSAGVKIHMGVYAPLNQGPNEALALDFAADPNRGWAVGLAHEFYHLLQMRYEYSSKWAFHEMSASWFAMRVYPTIPLQWRSNQRFLNALGWGAFQEGDQNADANALFLKTLAISLGDGVIKQLWELRARNKNDAFLYPEETWFSKSVDSLHLDVSKFMKYYSSEVTCMALNSHCDLNEGGTFQATFPSYSYATQANSDSTISTLPIPINPWAARVDGMNKDALVGGKTGFKITKSDAARYSAACIIHLPAKKFECISLDSGAIIIAKQPTDTMWLVFGFSSGGIVRAYPSSLPPTYLAVPNRAPVLVTGPVQRFDLSGRPLKGDKPRGVYYERSPDGVVRRKMGLER